MYTLPKLLDKKCKMIYNEAIKRLKSAFILNKEALKWEKQKLK